MARRVLVPVEPTEEERARESRLRESIARMAMGQPMAEAREAVGLEPVPLDTGAQAERFDKEPPMPRFLETRPFARGLGDLAEEVAAKPKPDVVLHALEITCGAAAVRDVEQSEAGHERAAEGLGFSLLNVERHPSGATVRWFANDRARFLVVVDELRMQFGAGIPPGALVYVDPPAGATEAECDAAEARAVEMGAQRVKKLPAPVNGTGGAAEAPAKDVGIREAVDAALAAVPADVREGARARCDGFLSAEGL